MRPTCENRPTCAAAWRMAMLTCVALGGLSAAASAQGGAHLGFPRPQAISILTNEHPFTPGSFTLTFDDLGYETSSGITETQFTLRVDHLQRKARFLEYSQHVDPLILPGGFSTGDITVEIMEGSSTGTYEPLTRTFTTSELYAIHFTGDLSDFGLTSPVILPSSSTGVVSVDPVQGGGVAMDWDGEGELVNPFDPPNTIKFTYRCQVSTVYPAAPDNLLVVGLSSDVTQLQLSKPVEHTLTLPLDFSLLQVQRGNEVLALVGLLWFEYRVELLRGWVIADADADALISSAEDIISLLLGG